MPGTLLIGYDVERIPGRVPGEKWVGRKVPEDATSIFLKRILKVHRDLNAPATIFMVGQNILSHLPELEACLSSGLFEIAQHTQGHYPLKTVLEEEGSMIFLRGLDFDKIEEQIAKPAELLRKHLGVDCKGLTTPYTFYRGLGDRPDILELAAKHGICYTRSYGRNSKDYFPLDWTLQPFRYSRQGFPNIVEFPVQGWLDAQWRHDNGWEHVDKYNAYLEAQLEHVAARGICWDHLQHDWTSILFDENLHWTRKFIEAAQQKLTLKTYLKHYEELEKDPAI